MNWIVSDCACATTANPPSVAKINSAADLERWVKQLCQLPSRVVIIGPEIGNKIHMGVGGPWAFVELHEESMGATRAIVANTPPDIEAVSFLMGGVPSDIDSAFLLPVEQAVSIVMHWYETGHLAPDATWEMT